MMEPPFLPVLAACVFIIGQVLAQDLGGRDSISDPDMLEAIESSKESNLDNSLENSRRDASQSSEYLLALMTTSREHIDGLVGSLASAFDSDPAVSKVTGEKDLLALQAVSEALGEDTGLFLKRFQQARLAPPKRGREELLSLGRIYTVRDRKTDLKLAETSLKKSAKRLKKLGRIALKEEQNELIAAASVFEERFYDGRRTCEDLYTRLYKMNKKMRIVKKMKQQCADLKSDLEKLGVEKRRLEVSMLLMRHEDESFDMTND